MVKFFFSINTFEMRFSEWLKLYRKEAKISQEVLAEKIGGLGFQISGAQISNYEREYDKDREGNPTRPSERLVEFAAQILNRPIDEARLTAGYAPESNRVLPEELQIMDYDGFDKDDLKDIAEYISFKRMQKEKLERGKTE